MRKYNEYSHNNNNVKYDDIIKTRDNNENSNTLAILKQISVKTLRWKMKLNFPDSKIIIRTLFVFDLIFSQNFDAFSIGQGEKAI